MAFAVNNIVRAAARQLIDGRDEVVNVFHFIIRDTGASGDESVLDEIGARISNAYIEIDQLLPNNLQPNVIDVFNISQDVPYGQIPWGGAYTGGTSSGNMNASGVSCLVLWTTNVKRVQGRTYLPPFVLTEMSDGVWGSGVVSDVSDWAAAMRDETSLVNDAVLGLIVWSDGAGLARNISGRRIVTIPAYQRRRRFGRGS